MTETETLQHLIHSQTPISIGTFMALCLGHPEHGYYMTKEPFGVKGDFTTAPEISQLFGEMLGVWAMTTIPQLPQSYGLQLVELGPGRGTLMSDLWRSLSAQPQLREQLHIHLVEFSPRLRAAQQEKLSGLPVTWHDTFDTVPQRPSLIIANEFFDALPIEQAEFHNGTWYERLITTEEEDLIFTLGKPLQGIYTKNPKNKDIFEYAPAATQMMEDLCYFLRKNKGAMVAIDYGDTTPLDERIGETLQALHEHKPCSVLEYLGECDLTAHVAFHSLCSIAVENGCDVAVTTQREFLTQLGIRLRSEKLLGSATLEQARAIKSGLERLIAPDQMGDLFKVMVVHSL